MHDERATACGSEQSIGDGGTCGAEGDVASDGQGLATANTEGVSRGGVRLCNEGTKGSTGGTEVEGACGGDGIGAAKVEGACHRVCRCISKCPLVEARGARVGVAVAQSQRSCATFDEGVGEGRIVDDGTTDFGIANAVDRQVACSGVASGSEIDATTDDEIACGEAVGEGAVGIAPSGAECAGKCEVVAASDGEGVVELDVVGDGAGASG